MKEPFFSYSKIFTSHNQRNFTLRLDGASFGGLACPIFRILRDFSLPPCVFRYLRSNRKKNGKNRGFMNQIGVRSLFRNIHR